MNSIVISTLILVTVLQSPAPAQQPTADVVAHARAALAAIGANEFTKVEDQFTGDMKVASRPAGWRRPGPCC